MIKNILVVITLLLWSVLMFTGIMQSVETERELQELRKTTNGECK